jgi:hypothetical protein
LREERNHETYGNTEPQKNAKRLKRFPLSRPTEAGRGKGERVAINNYFGMDDRGQERLN